MKKILMLLAGVLTAFPALAQQTTSPTTEDPQNVRNQRFVSVMPTYQTWNLEANPDETNKLSQISNQLLVYYQVNNQVLLSLRNTHGTFSATCKDCTYTVPETSLSGLGDTQVSVSYRLPSPNLIFNATVNLPTGRSSVSASELETLGLFSNQVLAFKLPTLGQGTAIMTGVSGAFPLNDQVVMGGGLSYIVNSGFRPLADYDYTYKPGNEVTADLGLNLRVGNNGSLGVDAMLTSYQEDVFVDQSVFKAGNKFSTVIQYRQLNPTSEWSAMLRYRSRAKNAVAQFIGDKPLEEAVNTNPAVMIARGTYRMGLDKQFVPGFTAELRSYEATPAWLSGALVFGFGFEPDFRVSNSVLVPLRIRYVMGNVANEKYYPTFGSLRELSASVGLYWSF